ncbi:MAG TPA: polysaccharide pyruvyl transferase family protein [Tepidisphaeraceae bacterium]|nr:polysaccharide pyruvyl transferase family protein [Tepidisphaeraceae bacterium]
MNAIAGANSVTVFDEGWGSREEFLETETSRLPIRRIGARNSRRYHRPESLWNIRMSCRLGGLANPGAKAILDSDGVLDISGGDSFTDLYGQKRFDSVAASKLIAIQNHIPLYLLPQTYGPFKSPQVKRIATRIIAQSRMAWARDTHSFRILQEMAGKDFNPARHRCGVDVAFALPTRLPTVALGLAGQFLDDRRTPLVGINVSGLILNDPEGSKDRFGLKADYNQVIRGLLSRVLCETDARVVLIPHVVTPPGHYESDLQASETIKSGFAGAQQDRIAVAPAFDDPRDVKWLIAQMDWFCGTRMHSTIAALSSSVPTAAVAYSDKTLGVFESCGQGKCVADPRALDTTEMVASLWSAWESRESDRSRLVREMPRVIVQAQDQMQEILRDCALKENEAATTHIGAQEYRVAR